MANSAKVLLTLICVIGWAAAQAQVNPFKTIGKEGKIIEGFNGKFEDVYDLDSIQRIGSVLINIKTMKIVKLLNPDKVYEGHSDNTGSSRWYSVDPLANEQTQWSPYNFAYDNPIRYNDPDGRVPGDYYDQQGNKIGTDGKNDQKVYVVTDQKEVEAAKQTTASGQNLDPSTMKSDILLPTFDQRKAMGVSVDHSNNPSIEAGDMKGGLHEEGGYYGKDAKGNDIAVEANPGDAYKPGAQTVGVNPLVPGSENSGEDHSKDQIEGTFHVHPGGSPGPGLAFVQPPSDKDLTNTVTRANSKGITGNNYVLGAGSGQVYIYKDVNGTGTVIGQFPLQSFLQVKAN